MHASSERPKGYRYPKMIISYAVYRYHRFLLSYRDVQELLFERGIFECGIEVSHETVRVWCAKFGPDLAEALRRRKPRRGRTGCVKLFQFCDSNRKYMLNEASVCKLNTIKSRFRIRALTASVSTSPRCWGTPASPDILTTTKWTPITPSTVLSENSGPERTLAVRAWNSSPNPGPSGAILIRWTTTLGAGASRTGSTRTP